MRGLLALAARAFPCDYRARRSGELVDTALLAANRSARRAVREALSLVRAGLRQRLRDEPGRSLGDGVALLAAVLALVNLSVAVAGIGFAVHRPPTFDHSGPAPIVLGPWRDPYALDWWWIAFAVAAAGCVLGLVLGNRRLAVVAAVTNLGIVTYDANLLAAHSRGHLNPLSAWVQDANKYPIGRDWLAPAMLLALTLAVAPLRRDPLARFPLAFVASVVLLAFTQQRFGFFYLFWPLAAIVVLALAFGWFAPRLAVLAAGLSLAVASPVVTYLNRPSWMYRDPLMIWVVTPVLTLGVVLPLAYVAARRRLT